MNLIPCLENENESITCIVHDIYIHTMNFYLEHPVCTSLRSSDSSFFERGTRERFETKEEEEEEEFFLEWLDR